MLSEKINKWSIATLAIFTALLIGGAATEAAAFSVDVKKLVYKDYMNPTTTRRVINYDFSGGSLTSNVITIPAGANGVAQVPPVEQMSPLTYTFGPYPDPTNDISISLNTGAAKATLTSAANGGLIINTTTTPNTPPVPQWDYTVALTNFTGMTDTSKAYTVSLGFGSTIAGPHPEYTAVWSSGTGGTWNLTLRAEIYDDTGNGTTVWGPVTTPTIIGFNQASGVIAMRIRCLDPNVGGNSMVFDYSLDNGNNWTTVATDPFGFPASQPPQNFVHVSFPGKFPFVSLRVESPGGGSNSDPFQIFSSHAQWAGHYYASAMVGDPGTTTTSQYTAVTVESVGINSGNPGYLAPTTMTYDNNQSWFLPYQQWPDLGTTLPSIFPTYKFTATKRDGSGTNVQQRTITGYVENFVTVTLPTYSDSSNAPASVPAAPTFTWTWPNTTQPGSYNVYVSDWTNGNNMVWNLPSNLSPSQTSQPYTGPLINGHTYQYTIMAVDNGGNNSSVQGYFTYTGANTTISFSGWVKTAPNWPGTDGMQPAAGAQVVAFSPTAQSTPLATTTVDSTTGAFTLTGIPTSSDFYLVVQPPQGYLPVLSKLMNWNDNIQALLPFVLFTPAQYSTTLGNTQGNGIIIGRVALQSGPTTFLPGATIVAREWISGPTPTLGATYLVTYTGAGSATGTDGIYMVKNVPAGKLVQLVATLNGYTFNFNGAIVPAQPAPVSEESFFGTPVSGGATISFSGNLGKYSDSTPISGATVEMVGNAAINTTTAADGSFTLPGLLPGAEFSVKFTGDAATYVSSYSAVMQSANPIVSPRAFNLFTPAELSGWGIAGGRGLIRGRVINAVNQQDGYISGAVVNYTSSKGRSYVVKYENVQGNLVDGATTANGKYYILNVEEGDIVNVSATQANYTFSQSRKFIAHDNAVCQGTITGTPIATRVAIGGFIMNQATTPVGIPSATVEQIGSSPVNSTVSNDAGAYYLTVPAGTNFFLKFSKPQAVATPLAPTYTAEMKFTGDNPNIGDFKLFTTSKLTDWGVTSGKGIIRTMVKDGTGNFLGGATVTAYSQLHQSSSWYTVCYQDGCPTGGLTATDPTTGRYIVQNVEPGDTVTVTAAKDGYTFNTRVFHTYADSVHQGGITGGTADEGLIRSRFNALLAEFNKGASANIDTILSFFSSNYLNDGENLAALRANMLKDLQAVPFQPRTVVGITVTITTPGAAATMVVNWGNGEIETFILAKDSGTGFWIITGNQKKYGVEAWSGTYRQPAGGTNYWVDMKVKDPQEVIDSVSVNGPKTNNTPANFSLIWNATEKEWRTWDGQTSVGPQFGTTKPSLPLNYTFNITEKANTSAPVTPAPTAVVNNFIELFATPISPAAGSTVTGVPTFNWLGVGGVYTYAIEVGSSSGGSQWGRYNVTGTSYVYDGPALAAGSSYYNLQVRDAAGNFSMVTVPFTYSGEILKGDIDGNGVVNLADAILAVKVIGGQTPDGIRDNYAASGADVNGDGQVGLHEALYILQRIAGLRDALNVWHTRTPSASDRSGSSTFFRALAGPQGFLIGGQGTIQKSLDGVTWYNSNIGSNSDNFLGLTGNVDGSLFAAGRFGLIIKSTDGATTWTVSKAASDSGFMGIAAGNAKIVAVGYDSGTNRRAVIYTSADSGANWTETTPTGVTVNSYEGVTFGNGKFVVAGYAFDGSAYTAVILTSTDGSTWTAANTAGALAGLRNVAWGGGKFIAVGNYGAVLTSPDGSNWAVQNSGITDKHFNDVGYGSGFYVIAGTDGTILTSTDGAAWTARSSGTTKHLTGVAFGNNTFLVVGGDSTSPIILQSDPL